MLTDPHYGDSRVSYGCHYFWSPIIPYLVLDLLQLVLQGDDIVLAVGVAWVGTAATMSPGCYTTNTTLIITQHSHFILIQPFYFDQCMLAIKDALTIFSTLSRNQNQLLTTPR